jgi:hypothetical protein
VKFTVVRSQRIKSPDLARAGKDDMWVLYRDEAGAIDSVTVPLEGFNEQALVLAVRQHEETKGRLQGRTLET